MSLSESTRKYILLGIVLFIILGVIVSKVLANDQDKQFVLADALYQQAFQLAGEGNYEEASLYINELLKLQPDSEAVNYLGGLTAANTDKLEEAVVLFQKTLDLNPYRVEDPMFMLQFGEILLKVERYSDAKIVLTNCQESGWAPEEFPTYQEQVTKLLNTIENM